jgi:tetratricopeptide (TPR) repeat protein
MSVRIHTANAAMKHVSGGPLPFKMVPVLAVVLVFVPALASQQVQESYPATPEMRSGEIRTLPSADSDRIGRNAKARAPTSPMTSAKDDTCLLPPLTLMSRPTVAAQQLQVPQKAKKDYQEACAHLKDGKTADAEKRLRKAVQEYPKYSAAWVTLGQVLAAQQRTDEARTACGQASTVDSKYVPAYLCLADLALRAHNWNEVLKQSNQALEIDPNSNALAYEYSAAANLNLHHLSDAEKSALRAVDIDKTHREPRVYFVLAQIYEAKGDSSNEAVQLREYLKYASNPDDVAMVEQYLSELEKQGGK